MKKIVLHFLLNVICFVSFADQASIVLRDASHQHDHTEYYPPADMPVVYFDSTDMEIIIVADGFADYYDVEIVSLGSLLTVISTQVDGHGDNVDVSTLPIGDYRLVITSSNNNVYEGYFAIE